MNSPTATVADSGALKDALPLPSVEGVWLRLYLEAEDLGVQAGESYREFDWRLSADGWREVAALLQPVYQCGQVFNVYGQLDLFVAGAEALTQAGEVT